MKELKYPHCGNVFTVNENDYAALLGQERSGPIGTAGKRVSYQ